MYEKVNEFVCQNKVKLKFSARFNFCQNKEKKKTLAHKYTLYLFTWRSFVSTTMSRVSEECFYGMKMYNSIIKFHRNDLDALAFCHRHRHHQRIQCSQNVHEMCKQSEKERSVFNYHLNSFGDICQEKMGQVVQVL